MIVIYTMMVEHVTSHDLLVVVVIYVDKDQQQLHTIITVVI